MRDSDERAPNATGPDLPGPDLPGPDLPGPDLPGPDWVPALPLDVRLRRQRGTLLVARQDTSVELDDVSAEIVTRIDGETSVADIAAAVSADFDVDRETATTDVREFLAQLTELGILVRDW